MQLGNTNPNPELVVLIYSTNTHLLTVAEVLFKLSI